MTPRLPLRRRARRRPAAAPRRGSTLIELMVALMVLTIGLLGLAGTAGMVVRQVGGARQQQLAAQVAHTRFELLRADFDCATLAGGTATPYDGVTETWTVTPLTRAVQVRDSVTFMVRGETRSRVFHTMLPCPAL